MDLINAGQVHDWMASTIDNNIVTDLYNVTQGFWSDKDIDNYLNRNGYFDSGNISRIEVFLEAALLFDCCL